MPEGLKYVIEIHSVVNSKASISVWVRFYNAITSHVIIFVCLWTVMILRYLQLICNIFPVLLIVSRLHYRYHFEIYRMHPKKYEHGSCILWFCSSQFTHILQDWGPFHWLRARAWVPVKQPWKIWVNIIVLVQDCSVSYVLAMEILQSCPKPSIYIPHQVLIIQSQQAKYTVNPCAYFMGYNLRHWI